MPSPSHRFPRAARLKRRRLIRPLFDRSRTDIGTVAYGCIRILYRIVDRAETGENVPIQVGFAPGRGMRPAVRRNRIKRLMREVYRVQQHRLVDLFVDTPTTLTMMILFRGRPDAVEAVPVDVHKALNRLVRRLVAKSSVNEAG